MSGSDAFEEIHGEMRTALQRLRAIEWSLLNEAEATLPSAERLRLRTEYHQVWSEAFDAYTAAAERYSLEIERMLREMRGPGVPPSAPP